MARAFVADPTHLTAILGTTFAKHEHIPILTIGEWHYDRWALGRLGCPHAMAASRLHRVCQELRIRTLEGLAREIHTIGAYKGLGVTAYYIALAILAEHGFDPVEVHNDPVTFATLKTRATKTQKRSTRKPRRAGPPSDAD
jgi:hypothetical protein